MAPLVAQGDSNQRIVSALSPSARTVGFHVKNIPAKSAFGHRARIAAWRTANPSSIS
ncbi:LuxR C-terminal-related transcriptional regulator [Streptomyces bottropensis]|uniref:LuxR C-terminal-related transcriptional regulator n=1 Tax=Streptomyces bottropensis TaxID=42235 RepID=UPI0036AB4B78